MNEYPKTRDDFHIEVRYDSGRIERFPIALDGGYWPSGGEYAHSLNRPPSHLVETSEDCPWASDSFSSAIGDGGKRSGYVTPDEFDDPQFEPFAWRIVGSEADLCRSRMAYWFDKYGPDVVLEMPYEGDLPDKDRIHLYDDNLSYYWWMSDPQAELDALVAARQSLAPGT